MSRRACAENNKIRAGDRVVHDWYRFVLSFPPHIVTTYLDRFGVGTGSRVLDPFCGTGTTLVECRKRGIASVGVEANPVACFASRVKVDWDVDPDRLQGHAREVGALALQKLRAQGIEDNGELALFRNGRAAPVLTRTLPAGSWELLPKNSISPLPLHKTLVLLDALREREDERFSGHERLALARAAVFAISNLHFGPEVGVGPAKPDAAVVSLWLNNVRAMADDLRQLRGGPWPEASVCQADSRCLASVLEPHSIDAVITSPPYPNEKDYTRTTRLESVLLGFIQSKQDLRALKRQLVRSNTRCVYQDDRDDLLVPEESPVHRLAEEIERRRIELGKTSGFERMYARVTKLYFGGMTRHLADLRPVLRPGAQLAYVVGDQGSYLRVMIRTGQLLAEIAQSLGYDVVGIDLFRTRLATATKQQLREEVVLLRWPNRVP
jgi:hypothetical protein